MAVKYRIIRKADFVWEYSYIVQRTWFFGLLWTSLFRDRDGFAKEFHRYSDALSELRQWQAYRRRHSRGDRIIWEEQ